MDSINASLLERLNELSKEELVDYVRRHHEAGIRISFAGKNKARQIARKVQPRVVRQVAKYSVGDEESKALNVLVEGENLQALATMYRERGQVDLILTDPPYNTGKDFRYNDKWDDDPNDPDIGELISEEDGARHTKWMKFMWPRLQMMRDMLKPTGVLAICIDHRELFHLGQMLDELFDEKNRIGIINWQKSYAPRNDNLHLSTATEYVLVYAKDLSVTRTGLLERSAATAGSYKNRDDDPKGPWSPADSTAPGAATHPGMIYGIQNPFTGKIVYPAPGRCWIRERAKMRQYLEEWGSKYEDRDLGDGRGPALVIAGAKVIDGASPEKDPKLKLATKAALERWEEQCWPELFFRMGGEGGRQIGHGLPRFKNYLEEVKKGVVATTYWADDDFEPVSDLGAVSWEHEQSGHSQAGQKELAAIVGRDHAFETVKPLALFWKVIQLWCPPSGLVVDPFAGSGTTGHAVLALNVAAAANRRFILVEKGRPEKGDSYARSLCADRLRRVVDGDWESGAREPLGGGFRFVTLQNKVDAGALLDMERDEMTDAVIASYFDSAKRGGPSLVNMVHEGHQYLVARNSDDEGFFLVWDGTKQPPVFDEETYESIVEEAVKAGLKPFYHVYARFNLYQSEDVRFYQIPNRILMDFGVSTSTDTFNNEEAVLPVDLD